jgi:Ribonuclease G/E
MSVDAILAETTPRAMRIALMEGDRLVSLHVDRPGKGHRRDDVFAGRITRVVPGLNAAFVDLGEGVTGFLRAKEADVEGSGAGIAKLVQEGGKVTVAIKTDGHDEKGPVLTRKFKDPDGVIAATGVRAQPPRLISRAEQMLVHLAGLWPQARVVADSPADLVALRRIEREGAVTLHQGMEALFEGAGVEDQLEEALVPEVRLPSGSVLRFEPTRTLTAIDVDSAGASESVADAVAINLEAVPVLAHQIRLRNLGGLIVIDFLKMQDVAAGKRLMASLSDHLAGDPVETALDGPSRFGLVEIARQRTGPTLAQATGTPVVAATERLIRRLRQESRTQGGAALEIRASPEVAAAFQSDDGGASIARWLGRRLDLIAEPRRSHDGFDIMAAL